jgi:cytochrome c biogenesis factor
VIFGVFFVRSGLLTSVHVFALDTAKGYFLFFFVLTLLGLIYFHFKFTGVQYTLKFKVNYILLFNFIIFLLLTILIILGTFMPTILKLGFNKTFIIGTQYFNEITLTLICGGLIYFIISLFKEKNYIFFLYFYIVLSICLWFNFDLNLLKYNQILICFILIVFYSLILYSLFNSNYSISNIIHIFFVIFGLHILILNWGSFEYFNIFRPGDFIYFLQYYLLFRGINIINTYNYYTLFGNFLLTDWFHIKYLSLIFPEKRFYFLDKFAGIKANIVSNYFSDIYIIIGDGQVISGWFIHLIYNPGMPIIWFCGFFIVFCFWYFLFKKSIQHRLQHILLW